jgi:anti-sigma regulatory factor (Ser/Thr protein kinase)
MATLDQLHVLPANLDELARVFELLDGAAEALSLPDERRGVVALVVEEAFVNLCRHAYRGREDGAVTLRLSGRAGELAVELRDAGPAFDPIREAPKPRLDASVEERRPGGLGVELMRRMTDEIRYRRDGDENVLTMLFRWPAG